MQTMTGQSMPLPNGGRKPSVQPTIPNATGMATKPTLGLKAAALQEAFKRAAAPQPGLTANMPMPMGGGAAPPLAGPTVANQMAQPQPISPQASPALAGGDPSAVAQAQQMGTAPPPPPGAMPQGQPQGPPPMQTPGGVTAPMTDPMPPTLPANPRPTPPQQQQPTQGVMDQSSDLNSLLDQKVDDDSPGQAMGDLKGQMMAQDVKIAHLLKPVSGPIKGYWMDGKSAQKTAGLAGFHPQLRPQAPESCA